MTLLNTTKLPIAMTLSNDGSGVVLSYEFRGRLKTSMTGGLLGSEVYELLNIHVHCPSTTSIEGLISDAGFHIIFLNKKCDTIDVAVRHVDGICMLAVLCDVS